MRIIVIINLVSHDTLKGEMPDHHRTLMIVIIRAIALAMGAAPETVLHCIGTPDPAPLRSVMVKMVKMSGMVQVGHVMPQSLKGLGNDMVS